MRFSNSMQ